MFNQKEKTICHDLILSKYDSNQKSISHDLPPPLRVYAACDRSLTGQKCPALDLTAGQTGRRGCVSRRSCQLTLFGNVIGILKANLGSFQSYNM